MPTAEDFQLRLWTDRYRGSEILFQPSIVGLESEGIHEILDNMLNHFGRIVFAFVFDVLFNFVDHFFDKYSCS